MVQIVFVIPAVIAECSGLMSECDRRCSKRSKRQRGAEILPLLREINSQMGKASQGRANIKVLYFDVTCAGVRGL